MAAHEMGIVEVHTDRFERIESMVDALQIWRREVDKRMPLVDALQDEMWNHDGVKGVKTILLEWITESRMEREQRKKDEQSARDTRERRWSNFRWSIATIIAIGMLILAALQVNKQLHSGAITLPHFHHTYAAPQYDAHSTPPPQDSFMNYPTPK